jgi:hypothetical protein
VPLQQQDAGSTWLFRVRLSKKTVSSALWPGREEDPLRLFYQVRGIRKATLSLVQAAPKREF